MNIPNPGHPQYFYGEVRPELPSNSFLPQDCSDCVFISNLPLTVQKDQIADLFSRAGKIRTSKGTFNCTKLRARFIFSRLFHRFGSFLEEISTSQFEPSRSSLTYLGVFHTGIICSYYNVIMYGFNTKLSKKFMK